MCTLQQWVMPIHFNQVGAGQLATGLDPVLKAIYAMSDLYDDCTGDGWGFLLVNAFNLISQVTEPIIRRIVFLSFFMHGIRIRPYWRGIFQDRTFCSSTGCDRRNTFEPDDH